MGRAATADARVDRDARAMIVRQQRGVALITILLIVALVSALLYHLVARQALVVAQTRQVVRADQSLEYALGAEAYARQILYEDWNNATSRALDTLTETWAIPARPFDIDAGTLEMSIEDLNRRFNLNALAGQDATKNVQRLKTMLAALNLDPAVAEAWKDWVDRDSEATGFGAEDGAYLVATPPFRAANQPAGSTSELALLNLLDGDQLALLLPHVTVLPTTTLRINVNTADAITLESLTPQLTQARAEALVESDRHYDAPGVLVAEIPELNTAADAMTVVSEYFEIHARAEIDGFRTELTSVIRRDPNTGRITLLSRDFGKRLPSIVEAEETNKEAAPG
jgi:general secretion pathway protein K